MLGSRAGHGCAESRVRLKGSDVGTGSSGEGQENRWALSPQVKKGSAWPLDERSTKPRRLLR